MLFVGEMHCSPNKQHFEKGKLKAKHYHSSKEHPKFHEIVKFAWLQNTVNSVEAGGFCILLYCEEW
jgi:hypothetical protein